MESSSNNEKLIKINQFDDDDDDNEELIKICLQKQIDELNLLTSIYPKEIKITEFIERIICDINEYLMETQSSSMASAVHHQRNKITTTLEYTVCLNVKQSKLYINIELPKMYPIKELANISIRSILFSTVQEINIKYNLKEFIQNIYQSEVYIYEIIRWIEENIDLLLIPINSSNENIQNNLQAAAAAAAAATESTESKLKNQQLFERVWIYSHHIKSKTKRNEIIKTAKHLELTGFSRPGKPGIICLEGLRTNTQAFWKIIKSLKWQKITIRKIEIPIIGTVDPSIDLMEFRKFKTFQELLGGSIAHDNDNNNNNNENDDDDDDDDVDNDGGNDQDHKKPIDMSYFMKYLDDHNCKHIKKDLFGFE